MTLSMESDKKTSRNRPPDFNGSKRRETNSSKEAASLLKSSSSGPFLSANRRSLKVTSK